jgi:glycosyltransferase involved in cell wall biosynthesis
MTNLCTKLVKKGLEIEVWSAQPSYTLTDRQPRFREYNGIKIHYLRSTSFHKDKVAGRILNYFTFFSSVILRLLFSGNRCTVISHTSPPFLAIIISLICFWRKRKFVYIIMDAMPDSLIRAGKLSTRSIFVKAWLRLHLSALKKCHKIVVIGRDMKSWLTGIFPLGADKIVYIPLWQDEELIIPADFNTNPFIIRNSLSEYFVVQYSGNMGLLHDMKTFGEAVIKGPDDVLFLFIGSGQRKKELLDTLKNTNRENFRLFPFLPNEEYAFSVSACHVSLISLNSGLEGMAVPSKIMGIMAAGIPVIALVPEQSEVACIIAEENCGILVKPGDCDGLLAAIHRLKSDPILRKQLGVNGREAFRLKYTTEVIAQKYFSLLNE